MLGNNLIPKYTLGEFTFLPLRISWCQSLFRPFSSNCTVLTASRAMLQAKDHPTDYFGSDGAVDDVQHRISVTGVNRDTGEKKKWVIWLGDLGYLEIPHLHLVGCNRGPTGRREICSFIGTKVLSRSNLVHLLLFRKLTINPSWKVSQIWKICSLLWQLSTFTWAYSTIFSLLSTQPYTLYITLTTWVKTHLIFETSSLN